jgi:DNA polymerase delta subunit 1
MIVDIQCIDYNPVCISDAFADESFNGLEVERAPSTVVLFGRGAEGSIAVRVPWQPWIRIAVPPGKTPGQFVHTFFPGCTYETKTLQNFYGYEPSKDPMVARSHEFVQVSLRSFSSASYAQKKKYFFAGSDWKVVDENSSWAARFCNDFGITECGWLRAPTKTTASWSTCTYECECLPLQLVVLSRMDIAPLRVLSFDCEMYSHDGLFPNPQKGDETIVTCATIWDYGKETRTVSLVKKPDLNMMEAFRDLIVREDPDIVTGWNIYGFDFQFLWNEYKKQERPYQRGLFTTRFLGTPSTFVERTMASSAKGDNTYRYWSMNGRIVVDLMQIIKDDKKPEDNTLKHVAALFLGPELGKLDVTPHEMFAAWKSQDKEEMKRVVTYCERDSEIPIALIQKLTYVPTWVELSRVCFTGLHAILNGGQQRRVYNVIARFVHNKYAINRKDSGWPTDSEDYEGATVIEPISGYYTDPVSVLDFESLYPSIMIYFNLCPSTMLLTDVSHDVPHDVPHDAHTIVHDSGPRVYKFAKHITGVLPQLLRHLLRSRKEVKKQMAAATGFDKFVLNGRQNALKIVCNSVYGFCGVSADKGLLPCKPVAAVTTLKGRLFIESAKNHVESNWPGSKVLYGDTDSIMVLWPQGLTVEQAYDLGTAASQSVTKLLQSGALAGLGEGVLDRTSVKLANEKVECPYLLIKKKNYAAVKWTPGKSGFVSELEFKGIDAVRRDRTKVVRDLSEQILDALLVRADADTAKQILQNGLLSVLENTIPLDDYILSKSLKGSYASENLPHVAAWSRMKSRGDAGLPPQGSRMPYIVTMPKKKKAPLYEIAEHPAYVKQMDLRPWALYYIEQIRSAVERLLEPTGIPVAALFEAAEDQAKFLQNGTASLKPGKRELVLDTPPAKKQKTAASASLKSFLAK